MLALSGAMLARKAKRRKHASPRRGCARSGRRMPATVRYTAG